ncbi:hypothetical protein [Dokdonella koreensis]|nr:hypothetical protein [Dokdonella koreensis]
MSMLRRAVSAPPFLSIFKAALAAFRRYPPITLPMLGLVLLSSLAQAQPKETSIYDEQGKLLRGNESVSPLGPELFGDKVSLYTGSLEFVQTDVSIPGNSALPVAVGRRYRPTQSNEFNRHFGDWDLEVPHVHGVFATEGWLTTGSTSRRCSQFSAPPEVTMGLPGGGSEPISPVAYWQGSFVYLPGSGDEEILQRVAGNTQAPTDGSSYPLLTKSGGMIRCISIGLNPNDEGFELLTPDGTRYRFNHMIRRQTRALTGGGGTVNRGGLESAYPPIQVTGENGKLQRFDVWIVPTLVTDRYGNTVTYTWSGSQLMSISSTGAAGSPQDTRTLNFTYASGLVQSVTAQSGGSPSRTWQYQYSGSRLWKVHQPDSSYWEFTLAQFSNVPLATATDPSNCNAADLGTQGTYTGTVRHPSGATGLFALTRLEHGRSWVKWNCIIPPGSTEISGSWSAQPRQFSELSLTAKTISGAGLPGYTWAYAYNENIGAGDYCWDPVGAGGSSASPLCTASSATTKTVSVTDPRGYVTRYTYGIRSEVNEGQLLKTEIGVSGGTAARTVTIEYQPVSAPGGFGYSVPWPAPYGHSIQPRGNNYMAEQIIPEKRRLTLQQATTFEWAVQTYDHRARPLEIVRNRVLVANNSITEKTTYHDNTAKWILGQVAKVEARQSTLITPWQVPTENTYDPTTATLTQQKRFGQVHRNYGWHTDGTLAWSRDVLNHQTTYGNYKRGIPQQIDYANNDRITAQVNDTGEISQVTQRDTSNNFAEYTVAYGYDDVGRLNRITPPAGDATAWNPTTLTFASTDVTEHGLSGTHWKQTVSTGDTIKGFQKTITYFDALWRPVRIDRHGTDGGGTTLTTTQRLVRMAYDADGRTTFESYPKVPASSTDPLDVGTTTTYDALGRVVSTAAATETQLYPVGTITVAVTAVNYLGGFRKEVLDPNGNLTTTSYQVFDEPTEDAPTFIDDPEGDTTLERDIFGKVTKMSRGSTAAGVRRYVYDDQHRLCKRIDPESRATVFAYDGAGNLDWQASGLDLPLDSCDTAAVPPAAKIDHTYDVRNRLTLTTYGDGSPSVSRSWTPDNRPQGVASGNATWTYKYNRRRLLLEERLNVTGTGGTGGARSRSTTGIRPTAAWIGCATRAARRCNTPRTCSASRRRWARSRAPFCTTRTAAWRVSITATTSAMRPGRTRVDSHGRRWMGR